MKQLILFIILIGSQITFAQKAQDAAFDQQLHDILSFSIPTISCEDLNKNSSKTIILDCREKSEYDVSHIKGAIHVGYEEFKTSSVSKLDKNAVVVVYCSVGYRSEKIGERLLRMGFKNVKNLYGSIFEWVNNGYPVVNSKGSTTKIHAVDENWAKWIKKGQPVFE